MDTPARPKRQDEFLVPHKTSGLNLEPLAAPPAKKFAAAPNLEEEQESFDSSLSQSDGSEAAPRTKKFAAAPNLDEEQESLNSSNPQDGGSEHSEADNSDEPVEDNDSNGPGEDDNGSEPAGDNDDSDPPEWDGGSEPPSENEWDGSMEPPDDDSDPPDWDGGSEPPDDNDDSDAPDWDGGSEPPDDNSDSDPPEGEEADSDAPPDDDSNDAPDWDHGSEPSDDNSNGDATGDEDTFEFDADNIKQYYDLQETSVHKSKVLATTVCDYEIKFKGLESLTGERLITIFEPVFESAVKELTKNLKSDDYFRITFDNPSLNNPVALPFKKKGEFNIDAMFEYISSVMQSYTTLHIDQHTKLCVISTNLPEKGAGRTSYENRRIASLPEWLKKKKSVINPTIGDGDKMCGFKALALAIGLADGVPRNVMRSASWQYDRAIEFAVMADLPLDPEPGPIGLEDFDRLKSKIADYEVTIYEPGANVISPIWTSGETRWKKANILLCNEHYWCITSVQGLLGKRYYCKICNQARSTRDHVCPYLQICRLCKVDQCQNREPRVNGGRFYSCDRCTKRFRTEACAKAHTIELCQEEAKCPTCEKFFPIKQLDKKKHACGMYYCQICMKNRSAYTSHIHTMPIFACPEDPPPDECEFEIEEDLQLQQYVLEGQKPQETKTVKTVVYYLDFETSIETTTKHISAISAVLQHEHGAPTYWFWGRNTVKEFLDTLLSFDTKYTRYIIVSHYGSGFDSYCYIRSLYDRNLCPKIILKNSKYIRISILNDSFVFLDSILFIQTKLRNLPKQFGLTEVKGYFPYSVLNEPDNLTATIPFPCREKFDYGRMMEEEQKEFMEWYNEAKQTFKHKPYNLLENLWSYNKADVDVLRQAMQRFRSDFVRNFGIDPLLRACTLTSATFLAWRRNHLKEDQVVIVADCGFPRLRNSRMGAVWMTFLSEVEGIPIIGHHNGIEERRGRFTPDGISQSPPKKLFTVQYQEKETLYFFFGCKWHGCPKCTEPSVVFDGKTFGQRWQSTKDLLAYYQERKANVVYEWSHQFEHRLMENALLKAINFRMGEANPYIKMRDAYFGGRVECFATMAKAENGSKILGFDFCSLYPYIMFSEGFNVKMPHIIRHAKLEDYGDIQRLKGMIYAKVLAPKGLFIPVLPYRQTDKKTTRLMFLLCRTCGEQKSTKCDCSEEERAFCGIWTTEELGLGVRYGYRILQIFEVWHWDETDHNLFKDFVRQCLKGKAEASGWPKRCKDESSKQAYLEEYLQLYQIELDPNAIRFNPGQRAANKGWINALSGRFGMKETRSSVKYVEDYASYYKLLTDKNIEITDINLCNDSMAMIRFTRDSELTSQEYINLVLISQITSFARIKLWEKLCITHNAGCKVLYCDTDSCYAVFPPNQPIPFPTGSCLGMMENQVEQDFGYGSYITEWWCSGAKSYATKIFCAPEKTSKIVFKLKGFRVNSQIKNLLTPETLSLLVEGQLKNQIKITYDHQILHNAKAGIMKSRSTTKILNATNDKRYVGPDYITYPYGYD